MILACLIKIVQVESPGILLKPMENAVLNSTLRDRSITAAALRRQKLIPAEYYGHGVANQSLALPYGEFRRLYRQAGENTIIELKVEGGKNAKVLVHQVDYHPVSGDITHVEFINVRMDEEVTTHIPVHLEGQAPAVKELGGVLIQSIDEIEIRCLPANLIHEVTLNVESLVDFQSALHVSDIVLPKNITLMTDAELTVVSVTPPRVEEAHDEAPVAVDLSAIEVTSEKKKDEE